MLPDNGPAGRYPIRCQHLSIFQCSARLAAVDRLLLSCEHIDAKALFIPMTYFIHRLVASVTVGAATLIASPAHAEGMIPATTVVLVHESEREASLLVRNDDKTAALLYSSLEDVPEDQESLLIVTPPVTRVEPGKSQLVRFILQNREPLKTQRLKRVTFEGIQPKDPSKSSKVAVTVRQNLPVIIHPKGLPLEREPWKLLTWTLDDGKLTVHNDSPYVVRLAQNLRLLPSDTGAEFPRTYVLPGENIAIQTDATPTSVEFVPGSLYGFAMPPYQAQITSAATPATE